MSVPVAVGVIKNGLEIATRALCGAGGGAQADVLATLRQLLSCPSLRDVATKASRLKSLATFVIQSTAKARDRVRADTAASAVLRLLQGEGIDIVSAGSLEQYNTPLVVAIQCSLLGAAAVLLCAGADSSGRSNDGSIWPLAAAVITPSDAGMTWLLEHGASVTTANSRARTLAHLLPAMAVGFATATGTKCADFGIRWLRHLVTAEPSLLEMRDEAGQTPLLSAAGAGSDPAVALLLELAADVSAVDATDDTALSSACAAFSLPVVRRLIGAAAASPLALPAGSRQARRLASMALFAALSAERRCGACDGRCRGFNHGTCADGLDILRAILAAGVREAVGSDGLSLALMVIATMTRPSEAGRISVSHALSILQALHAGGVDVLARGPSDAQPILHAAAGADAPDIVRWLVGSAGAATEERSASGYTPLLLACTRGAWAAALALLDRGARVDSVCDIDGTAQTVAKWATEGTACKSQEVKRAIAARAREHAAQASREVAAAKVVADGASSARSFATSDSAIVIVGRAIVAEGATATDPTSGAACAGAGAAGFTAPAVIVACSAADFRVTGAAVSSAPTLADSNACEEPSAVDAPAACSDLQPSLNLPEDPSAAAACSARQSAHNEPEDPSATSAVELGAHSPALEAAAPSHVEGAPQSLLAVERVDHADVRNTPAALIAALHCEGVSVAAVRRHLAALTVLAHDPAGAAALQKAGVMPAICATLSRHGAAVARAVTGLMAAVSAVAGESEGEPDV